MKFIKRMIKTVVKWAFTEQVTRCAEPEMPQMAAMYGNSSLAGNISHNKTSHAIDSYNDGFDFTVFSAHGGKIIRVHNYDKKLEKHISNLYIITDKEDFGTELSQIITRDSLSR